MALINCAQCGNPNAATAKTCPKCGADLRVFEKRAAIGCLALLLVPIAFIVLSGSSNDKPPAAAQAHSVAAAPEPDPVIELHQKLRAEPAKDTQNRERVIEALKATQIISRVVSNSGGNPSVFVGPGFYGLSVDDKTMALRTLFLKYFRETSRPNEIFLVLLDGKSGKEIGSFDPRQGGLNLE